MRYQAATQLLDPYRESEASQSEDTLDSQHRKKNIIKIAKLEFVREMNPERILKVLLKKDDDVETAYVFGSKARGESGPLSTSIEQSP